MAGLLGMSLDNIGKIQLGQLIPENDDVDDALTELSDLRVSDYNVKDCKNRKWVLMRSKLNHATITSDGFQEYSLKNPEGIC